jgi:2-keto-4-pentenoate hydratase/2-oxohepta-3-ene-1,7-dioic acid hydratase in catechol pathway
MRLVTFVESGRARVGVLDDEHVVDVGAADPGLPPTLSGLLHAGPEALERVAAAGRAGPATARHPLEAISLRPPIEDAGKILCLGLNYAEHAAESGHGPPPAHPTVFMRSRTSLVGHDHPVVRPRLSEQLDFEGELAVIIGRRGRHVPEAAALDHVAGYAPFNDGSVRDVQYWTSQWTLGKNFDATGGFGPALVTADELPPGATGLRLMTRLNGRVVQDGNTGDMIFPVARIVALLSGICTLEPGDVIATGTPAGVGKARTPPFWLKPGDVVEVEIEGAGLLRNPVVDEVSRA